MSDLELSAVAARLAADGQRVTSEQLPGGPALVGYRSDFRLRWMATKLHLFTVAVAVPTVTGQDLDRFTRDALDLGVRAKGRLRGLQSGVGVIAVMLGPAVSPDAAAFASERIVRKFGAFAWPAVVDTSTHAVFRHQGSVVLGGVYAKWLRRQTALAIGR